jgi:hypothetical protein
MSIAKALIGGAVLIGGVLIAKRAIDKDKKMKESINKEKEEFNKRWDDFRKKEKEERTAKATRESKNEEEKAKFKGVMFDAYTDALKRLQQRTGKGSVHVGGSRSCQ